MFRLLYNFSRVRMQKIPISISPSQQNIFDLLLQFRQDCSLPTVIRVAGGWVRDKIMGKESHDIDFALDNMDGETFTLLLKKYCAGKSQFTNRISGFGVTKFNPEQSKNLRTATVKINDHMIDIVNLRSEKYTEDSRIPEIEIGTPKEDAFRRDLTINALFYNIVTREIEDHTGKGLDDIKNGIIRTPLDPYVTFKDDPLRILRAFRFAGRFGYQIQPEIFEAALQKDISEYLRVKVSKQRVGIELSSMLRGPHPQLCMEHILKCRLWNIVFQNPVGSTLTDPNVIDSIPERSFNFFKDVVHILNTNPLKHLNLLMLDKDTQKQQGNQKDKTRHSVTESELWQCIFMSALTYVYQPFSVKQAKGLPTPLIQQIVKTSLKRSNNEALFPLRVNDGAAGLISMYKQGQLKDETKLGKWMLKVEEKWEVALLIASAAEPESKQQFQQVYRLIVDNNWTTIYRTKPLIDGTYLLKDLGKKGKSIGTILSNVRVWSFMNPGKSREELIQTLKCEMAQFQDPNMFQ